MTNINNERLSGIVQGAPAIVNTGSLAEFPRVNGRARVLKVGLNFRDSDARTLIMITTRDVIEALQANPAFKFGYWINMRHGVIESYNVTVLGYSNGDDAKSRHYWESMFEDVIYHENSKSVR
jgi:hypothetical protein